MPTLLVAKHFGVTDKAIEKRCKKLGVVKPSRGYWAKKKASEC
jgi:Zn-dependent peptidase ImmA (M78 family)